MYNVVTGRLPFADDEKDFIGKLKGGLTLTFPEREWTHYSPDAISFTRALLSANPETRLTALAALVHPWLDDVRRFGSSRIAANGRFSQAYGASSDHSRLAPQSQRMSALFPIPAKKRASWLVAFIAIKAANRFIFLVMPNRTATAMRLHISAGEDAEWASDDEIHHNGSGGKSHNSNADFSPHSPGSDSYASGDLSECFDTPSSSRKFGALLRSLQGNSSSQSNTPKDDSKESAKSKSRELNSQKGVGDLSMHSRKVRGSQQANHSHIESQGTPAQSPTQKSSGRQMLPLKRMSGTAESKKFTSASSNVPSRAKSGLATFRKKFTHYGTSGIKTAGDSQEGQSDGNSPMSLSSEDAAKAFDMSLGIDDLSIECVDEENENNLAMDGPSTFHGTRHRALMAKDFNPNIFDNAQASSGPSSFRNLLRKSPAKRLF
jgi:hypothetical protein